MIFLPFLNAVQNGPHIDQVVCLSSRPAVLKRLEFRAEFQAKYDNPFDPADVSLDALVHTPSGKTVSVPGFLYRPYTRALGKITFPIAYASDEARSHGATIEQTSDKGEVLAVNGAPSWRVRFTPRETGRYRFEFTLKTHAGIAKKATEIKVVAGKRENDFIGIDPSNPLGFRTSTGKSYFPIGANMCWAGARGTYDYDDWLPKYGQAKANWGRLWLSPMWTTFALEQPGSPNRLDLANAWRLDYVMDEAAEQGIAMTLCIDSYNILRAGNNWPEWDRSPFNKKNGGSLAQPFDFWSDPDAARQYKNKLRYIVARWGADSNVFAWEFWNEVDGITDYRPASVMKWHREMSDYLRSIDPDHHLISTSFGGDGLNPGIFSLPNIDYSVAHIYNAPDESTAVASTLERLKKLGKPTFIEECGADSAGSRTGEDPTGLQLHDPLWVSLASGASGGSMLWWWDSLIEPKNLYPQFAHVQRFMSGIDWGRQSFHSASSQVFFLHPPKNPILQDLAIEGAAPNWSACPQNRPQTVDIDSQGAHGGPVSALLHGQKNHPDLHNPIRFVTNLGMATTLDVQVGKVSGYGGAALKITLDGKVVSDEDFKDPDGDAGHADLTQYEGVRKCPIPAGRHEVVVENGGADWVTVEYSFEKAQLADKPPVKVWASVGKTAALAWVRLEGRTWTNVIERKQTFPPCPPSYLTLNGLRPGVWRVEIWDTWSGSVVGRSRQTVGGDGKVRVLLPEIKGEGAVKALLEGW